MDTRDKNTNNYFELLFYLRYGSNKWNSQCLEKLPNRICFCQGSFLLIKGIFVEKYKVIDNHSKKQQIYPISFCVDKWFFVSNSCHFEKFTIINVIHAINWKSWLWWAFYFKFCCSEVGFLTLLAGVFLMTRHL